MRIFIFLIIFFGLILSPMHVVFASTKIELEGQIGDKNKQIEEMERQIEVFRQEAASKKGEAATIQGTIARLMAEIKKSELEIKSLSLAIEGISLQINKTENQVQETEAQITNTTEDLFGALRAVEKSERLSSLELLVSKPNFSSFISDIYDLYFLQSSVKRRVTSLKEMKIKLEEVQDRLGEELKERQELKALEEVEKIRAASKRQAQNEVLTKVKKEESKIINKIKVAEVDLGRVKEQITYLVRAGVSVEDAIRYGQLAAIRLGVRPAFLIALLDIESRLGLNVGKGTWKKDMHPRDHDAFLAITDRLNLNPDLTPVSKKPNYGWGGAMGPAQFLPNTWLAYEAEVARFTGRNPPSPWNIEDAFTAAAIKLARQGANSKTRAGETAAAKAYIGGSSKCSKAICNYYAKAVLNKAEELEDELGS